MEEQPVVLLLGMVGNVAVEISIRSTAPSCCRTRHMV